MSNHTHTCQPGPFPCPICPGSTAPERGSGKLPLACANHTSAPYNSSSADRKHHCHLASQQSRWFRELSLAPFAVGLVSGVGSSPAVLPWPAVLGPGRPEVVPQTTLIPPFTWTCNLMKGSFPTPPGFLQIASSSC